MSQVLKLPRKINNFMLLEKTDLCFQLLAVPDTKNLWLTGMRCHSCFKLNAGKQRRLCCLKGLHAF